MAALAGCATVPAPTLPYHASGYEPGWTLDMSRNRIVYVGDYGQVRIQTSSVPPSSIPNGVRYMAQEGGHSLTIDITHAVCRGASGAALADTVRVTADGKQVEGCGGTSVAGEP
jgi:heat shock protein HslJ